MKEKTNKTEFDENLKTLCYIWKIEIGKKIYKDICHHLS